MRARVTLRSAESFTGRGAIVWRKGQSRNMTDAASIAYYKGQAVFVVTDLPDAPKAEEPEEDAPATFTENELERLKKDDLVDLAAKGYGLVLDGEQPKKELVVAILEAQGQGG